MRKQLIIAGRLPAQCLAERIRIHRDQEQSGLSEEMLARGLGDLGGGGEMDVAVPGIIGAAAVDALPFGLAPGRSRADFVDHAQASNSCLSLSPKDFPGNPGNCRGPYRWPAGTSSIRAPPCHANCRKPLIAPIIPCSDAGSCPWPSSPKRGRC